jgi:hypothetical protein
VLDFRRDNDLVESFLADRREGDDDFRLLCARGSIAAGSAIDIDIVVVTVRRFGSDFLGEAFEPLEVDVTAEPLAAEVTAEPLGLLLLLLLLLSLVSLAFLSS